MTKTQTDGAEPAQRGVALANGGSRYGAVPLLALGATLALSSGETSSLSQAVNGIQRSFHVSNATVALLPVAMAVVGIVGAVPFGFLADRRRRTFVLATAMLAWTATMGLNGLAWSFGVLLAFRLGVGFAEASSSAAVSLIADYYPLTERAAKMGWYQAGNIAGGLVGFVGGGVAVAIGGWRWAFLFWVPFGVGTVVFLASQPEPGRGSREAEFEAQRRQEPAAAGGEGDVAALALGRQLPAPRRLGTLDYRTAGVREVLAELRRIPSMWWALLTLTIAQAVTAALSFWAIPFFERVDHLSSVRAGAFTALLLPAGLVGILGGGILSDRLTRRGLLNARIYVVTAASAVSAVAVPIGFGTRDLAITAIFLTVGACAVAVSIAPAEALFNDVVVAELRGRAASVRSIVRSVSSVGPLVVGVLADHMGGSATGHATGLQPAMVLFACVCGGAGVAFIFARHSYAHDVAFVCAETARLQRMAAGDGPALATA